MQVASLQARTSEQAQTNIRLEQQTNQLQQELQEQQKEIQEASQENIAIQKEYREKVAQVNHKKTELVGFHALPLSPVAAEGCSFCRG